MSNTCTYHFEQIIGYCLGCRYYICTPCLTEHLEHLPKIVVMKNLSQKFDTLHQQLSTINQSKSQSIISIKLAIDQSKTDCLRYFQTLQNSITKEQESYKKTVSSEKYLRALTFIRGKQYQQVTETDFQKLYALVTNNTLKQVKQQHEKETAKITKVIKSTQQAVDKANSFFRSGEMSRAQLLYFQKGDKAYEDKFYDSACQSYSKGLQQSLKTFASNNYAKYAEKHIDAFKKNNNQKGLISLYQTLYTLEPQNPNYCYNVGLSYLKKQHTTEAMECFNKAQQAGFKTSQLYSSKGDCYQKNGNLEDALKMYDKAIELQPSNPMYPLKKANIYKSLGDFKNAENCIQKSIAVKPTSSVRVSQDKRIQLVQAQILQQSGSFSKAIDVYNNLIDINPHDPSLYFYRGKCEFILKQYDIAIQSFEGATKRNPNIADYYKWKAKTNQKLERKEPAIRAINDALSIQRTNKEFLQQKVNILKYFKQNQKALECCEVWLDQQRNSSEAWFAKGELLEILKRNPESLKCYAKAESLKPDKKYTEARTRLENTLKKSGAKCFG